MRASTSLASSLVAALLAFAPAAGAAPSVVPAGHPLLGRWELSYANSECTDVYEYRPDGTGRLTSADEVLDLAYTVDAKPSNNRFFHMQLKVVKDHGGVDCNGSGRDDTGDAFDFFVFINSERSMHLLCRDESFQSCAGTFRRAVPRPVSGRGDSPP